MPMVMGRRLPPSRSSVEAKRKSDQAHRKANNATVIAEFREMGRTTDRNVRQCEAPSSWAACSSASGIPRMKAVKSITANGMAIVESAMISPGMVSYTHLRAHETRHDLVCRLLLEKK